MEDEQGRLVKCLNQEYILLCFIFDPRCIKYPTISDALLSCILTVLAKQQAPQEELLSLPQEVDTKASLES